jgi:hypothetical protein
MLVSSRDANVVRLRVYWFNFPLGDKRLMAFQVDRSSFDPESGFEYYICFKPESQVEGDEVHSRISLEIGVSVTETGDVADLSFMLPKACRSEFAMSYLLKDPSVSCVENRVFVSIPGLSGDAVLEAPGTVELDSAGRIVAVEINGCIPHTTTFRPGRA